MKMFHWRDFLFVTAVFLLFSGNIYAISISLCYILYKIWCFVGYYDKYQRESRQQDNDKENQLES